jgi:hypothetical protein
MNVQELREKLDLLPPTAEITNQETEELTHVFTDGKVVELLTDYQASQVGTLHPDWRKV